MNRGTTTKLVLGASAVLCLLFYAGARPVSQLERIIKQGEIRVVTRNGPTTFYIGRDGETGLEYEMVRRFADHLGVKLKLIIADNTAEIFQTVARGKADLAAASLKNVSNHQSPLMFGPGYQWVTQQLIFRNGNPLPTSLDDIQPEQLHLANGTIESLHLDNLRQLHPDLAWKIHLNADNHELLEKVENGEIPYTVADSNEVTLARQYYPEIRAAFNLSQPQPLAWGIRRSTDHSLLDVITEFHQQIAQNGELPRLINRFYGPVRIFDYVDSRRFINRYQTRFQDLMPLFVEAATQYSIDWRLLAAISYQESHWNPLARSPTGVRGLMMLTQTTARTMGVSNRLDPEQSIDGGAKYLRELINRIPERIQEPDRTWLALAAYNVGYGHLDDARILTEKHGGHPDKWEDVRKNLPLLSRKQWYKFSRYGYARGIEPVRFVEKVRKYFNMIVQLTQPIQYPGQDIAEPLLIDPMVL